MVLLEKERGPGVCIPDDLFTALLQGGIDRPVESSSQLPHPSTTHLLTYATHDAGTFKMLVNNDQHVNVTVLGWNQAWNDYRDRWAAYRDEILHRGCMEDVFILADAFDVQILQPIEKAREAFDSLEARLVVSEATWQNCVARRMYLTDPPPFSLGRSEHSSIACAGLVMGYGREIVQLATIITKSNCTDDQRTLNTALPFIEGAVIDKERRIFCTLKTHSMPVAPGAAFAHYPGVFGQLTAGRVLRSVREYSQYFVGDVAIIFLCITFLLLMFQHVSKPSADAPSLLAASPIGTGSLMATYTSGCGCVLVLAYLTLCNKN